MKDRRELSKLLATAHRGEETLLLVTLVVLCAVDGLVSLHLLLLVVHVLLLLGVVLLLALLIHLLLLQLHLLLCVLLLALLLERLERGWVQLVSGGGGSGITMTSHLVLLLLLLHLLLLHLLLLQLLLL